MSQNCRSSKRKLKLPAKFKDHVVNTVNHNNGGKNNTHEEVRAQLNASIGKKWVMLKGIWEGVFGNMDNNIKNGVSSLVNNTVLNDKCMTVNNTCLVNDSGYNNFDDNSILRNKEMYANDENKKETQSKDSKGLNSYGSMDRKDEVFVNKKLHLVAPKNK